MHIWGFGHMQETKQGVYFFFFFMLNVNFRVTEGLRWAEPSEFLWPTPCSSRATRAVCHVMFLRSSRRRSCISGNLSNVHQCVFLSVSLLLLLTYLCSFSHAFTQLQVSIYFPRNSCVCRQCLYFSQVFWLRKLSQVFLPIPRWSPMHSRSSHMHFLSIPACPLQRSCILPLQHCSHRPSHHVSVIPKRS